MADATYRYGARPTLRFVGDPSAIQPAATLPAVTVKTRTPSGAETSVNSPNAALTQVNSVTWDYGVPAAMNEAGQWSFRIIDPANAFAPLETTVEIEGSAFTAP